jgi:rubrerythrin
MPRWCAPDQRNVALGAVLVSVVALACRRYPRPQLERVSTAEDRHHWAVLRTSTELDPRPFDYPADF